MTHSLTGTRHQRSTPFTSFNNGMSLEAIAALLGHASMPMTMTYARISDRTVSDEYFAVTTQVENLYAEPRSSLPAEAEGPNMRRLRGETTRLLGNGHCTRPAALDCRYETICETCTHFATNEDHRQTLTNQLANATEHDEPRRKKVYLELHQARRTPHLTAITRISVQFCLDLHHEAGGGQLLLQLPFLPLQAGDLLGLRVAPAASARNRQPSQRTRIARLAPRHDVAGIQALPTQQRTLLTIGRGVVGGQHLQLVLRRERPPPGTLRHLRVGPLSSSTIHPTRIFDPGRSDQRAHLARHLGGSSPSPPSGH
jgi:hypothetical protein